jgi:hypothetical protein
VLLVATQSCQLAAGEGAVAFRLLAPRGQAEAPLAPLCTTLAPLCSP